MGTLFIGGDLVRRLLPMRECIELMSETFADLAAGRAGQPLRTIMRLPGGRGLMGLMPAQASGRGVMAAKALSVFPGNARAGLGSHQGVVLLFETEHGRLLAIVDAEAITAIRTPAASAVATGALARESATTLALLGAGVQARGHLEAMCLVRPIARVRVWDLHPERADSFAKEGSAARGIPVVPAATAREAVAGADIVCTLTASKQPILESGWVAAWAHVNAVGACTPDAREIDTALMARARVFTDCRESLLAESGDFLIPVQEGAFEEGHLCGELGALVTGAVRGRESDADTTVFVSLGIAAEDLVAADHVFRRCRELGLGVPLEEPAS